MFHQFILLIQALFIQGGTYTGQQYTKAIAHQMNELQAVHQTATASVSADGTVCVTTANGSVIIINPEEAN
jgi:hypothetical protein